MSPHEEDVLKNPDDISLHHPSKASHEGNE